MCRASAKIYTSAPIHLNYIGQGQKLKWIIRTMTSRCGMLTALIFLKAKDSVEELAQYDWYVMKTLIRNTSRR